MEFWGVEVKSGTPLKVKPGKGRMIHLSQATIGEVKANKEAVSLFVTVDGKKLVLGTLLSDKLPQQQLDLVFEKDFELSHNSKSGSIYFFGYKGIEAAEDEEGFDSDDSEEEDISLAPGKGEIKAEIAKPVVPEKAEENKGSAATNRKVKIVEPTKDEDDDSEHDDTDTEDESDSDDSEEEDIAPVTENGKRETKAEKQKSIVAPGKAKESKVSAAGKQKVKIDEPTKDEKPEDDDTEDDDSDEDETSDGDSMDEDDDSEESEEDEETPKKVDVGKKRAAESAIKTPVPEKKAKLATPQKTDGKKNGGHVATPYPKKQVVKTQASKPTPKPDSLHSCGTCNKGFSSENALQSHTKAKHSAGK